MASVLEILAEASDGRTSPSCMGKNDCKDSQVSELAIAGALSPESIVATDAKSFGDAFGRICAPMPDSLNIGSSDRETKVHQQKDMEITTEIVCAMKTCKTTDCISSDQKFLQKAGTEYNLLSSDLAGDVIAENKSTGTASIDNQEQIRIGRSPAFAGPCLMEVIDAEKDENQFVCRSSKGNNKVCQEAELKQSIDDCLRNETVLESHDSCSEVADVWEDEQIKVKAGVLMPVLTGDALDKAHIWDKKDPVGTASLKASSSDGYCKEEKGLHVHCSDSTTLSLEPTMIRDQDSNQVAANQTADPFKKIQRQGHGENFVTNIDLDLETSICHGLDQKRLVEENALNGVAKTCSPAFQSETLVIAEIRESVCSLTKKECNATSADLACDKMNGDAASLALIHNLKDAKDPQVSYATKNLGKGCDPLMHVNVAEAEEFTDPLAEYECKASHENTSGENRLLGMNEGLVLEDYRSCGHLVSIGDAASAALIHNLKDSKDFQVTYATKNIEEGCPLMHVNVEEAEVFTEPLAEYECKAGHDKFSGENCMSGTNEGLVLEEYRSFGHLSGIADAFVERSKGNAVNEGEDCVSAAAANRCSLLSSPTSATQIQVREDEMSKANSNLTYRNAEGILTSETKDEATSSSFRHDDCMPDKDGGTSSACFSGNKPRQFDGSTSIEREEVSSVGGEDTITTPECMQSLRQQRKKINIHHQFVREIVKIQHDREQYDREQAERQIQAQLAANSLQVGCKSLDNKDYKDARDTRCESNKQKALKNMGIYRQFEESHQFSTKREKSSLIETRNDIISHHWNPPQCSHKQDRPAFPSVKQLEKRDQSKQHRPFSIYRPPIAREAFVVEHTKLEDSVTVNQQSATFAMNNSFNRSGNFSSKSGVSMAGASHSMNEGQIKGVGSDSGECHTDSLQVQADRSAHGMGIQVTFDTQKWQRHIHLLGGTGDSSKGELATSAVCHSSSGYGANRDFKLNPSSSKHLQASKFPLKSRQQIEHGEMLPKGNEDHAAQVTRSVNPQLSHEYELSGLSSAARGQDGEQFSIVTDHNFASAARKGNALMKHFLQDCKSSSRSRPIDRREFSKDDCNRSTQAARSDIFLQDFASAEPSQSRERVGKLFDKQTDKKNSFFEPMDNSANLHDLSSWLYGSTPLIESGSDGQIVSNNSKRQSEWSAGAPSPSSQSLRNPIPQRTMAVRPSFDEAFVSTNSVATTNVRSEELKRSAINTQGKLQRQQLSNSRFNDSRGSARFNSTNDNSRLKKDFSHKKNTQDFSSPFQAMLKDTSRPTESLSAMPAQRSADTNQDFGRFGKTIPAQRSSDTNQDSKGLVMGRHTKDHVQMHENSQEILRWTQPEASRKTFVQNLQVQTTSSPLSKSLFCIMPMQEKWGDVVDDSNDSYDYLQFKSEDDRESQSGIFSYGGSNQSSTGESQLSSPPVFPDSTQDIGLPQNSYRSASSLQKHNELSREHLKYQTPGRKSVFERLGPQNSFQDSILGPPPKILDGKGVLKASPDALLNNVQHVSNFRSVGTGFHGSQWAPPSHVPLVQHENTNNSAEKGREVVVQAYTEVKQRRSKRELYVPRRGS